MEILRDAEHKAVEQTLNASFCELGKLTCIPENEEYVYTFPTGKKLIARCSCDSRSEVIKDIMRQILLGVTYGRA